MRSLALKHGDVIRLEFDHDVFGVKGDGSYKCHFYPKEKSDGCPYENDSDDVVFNDGYYIFPKEYPFNEHDIMLDSMFDHSLGNVLLGRVLQFMGEGLIRAYSAD